MLNTDEFANKVSPASRIFLGITCTFIGLVLAISAWITDEMVVVFLTFIAGLPIGLVGLSLLFGKARGGNGIFSSFTLYVIGVLIVAVSIAGAYAGQPKAGVGILFAMGCFALAKKRGNQRKPW